MGLPATYRAVGLFPVRHRVVVSRTLGNRQVREESAVVADLYEQPLKPGTSVMTGRRDYFVNFIAR